MLWRPRASGLARRPPYCFTLPTQWRGRHKLAPERGGPRTEDSRRSRQQRPHQREAAQLRLRPVARHEVPRYPAPSLLCGPQSPTTREAAKGAHHWPRLPLSSSSMRPDDPRRESKPGHDRLEKQSPLAPKTKRSGSAIANPDRPLWLTSLWRYRWDLNPRWSLPHTCFRDMILRPLGHGTGREFSTSRGHVGNRGGGGADPRLLHSAEATENRVPLRGPRQSSVHGAELGSWPDSARGEQLPNCPA